MPVWTVANPAAEIAELNDLGDHMAGDQYSRKLPAPPFINFSLSSPGNHNNRGYDIGPVRADAGADFLPAGQLMNIQGLALGGWQYVYRREAQSILPFLYLGPASYTREISFLRDNGITMLIVVAPSKNSHFVTAAPNKSTQELDIPIEIITADTEQDMSRQYKTIIPKINQHLSQCYASHIQGDKAPHYNDRKLGKVGSQQNGKVLLACESGNHNSAALAAAYLMYTFDNVNHQHAMACVNLRRVSCDFTPATRQSLYTWHLWLEAQRAVSSTSTSNLGRAGGSNVKLVKQKRSFMRDDGDDDDEGYGGDSDVAISGMSGINNGLLRINIDAADDAERFHNRRYSPFVDSSD